MPLSAAGHALHTRSLSVMLSHTDSSAVAFAAYVLDLRKRGFAPVAGDLQPTGIIHHMRLDGAIDRQTLAITRIAAHMPAVAFEPSPATGGESCRDLIGNVAHLTGLRCADRYASALGAEIGGVRGCSHILTLAHLLGPAAEWGLNADVDLHGRAPGWRAGERIFRRDVTLDGYELEDGRVRLTAQLNDLHCAPTPPAARPMDHLAAQREITISADLTLPGLVVQSIDAHERYRTLADVTTAGWVSRAERVAPMVGLSLRPGVSGAILRHFTDPEPDAPLREALLMLAPAMIQCFAALDLWMIRLADAGDAGGLPDSCYMWRRDGALQRSRS